MTELKPCTHCGSDDTGKSINELGYFITCNECHAQVRSLSNISDAENKWNRRV